MSKKSRAEKVVAIFKDHPDEKLTFKKVAEIYMERHPDDVEKLIRTSRQEHLNPLHQIRAGFYVQEKKIIELSGGKIKVEGSRPRKYYYTEKSDEEEIVEVEQSALPQREPLERELYGDIVQFLYGQTGIYCKIIDDRKSSNHHGAGGNQWLHPDIVGCGDLSVNWKEKTKEYSRQFGSQHLKLWSFEVKKLVNRSNVRAVFFQAVSNSSWANHGYLIGNFTKDALDELKILSPLHGIGVIQYNPDDDDDSNGIEILAKEKTEIDWGTVNRLLNENNKDFEKFMKNVRTCHKIGELIKTGWDTTIEDE